MSAIDPADMASHADDTPGASLPSPLVLVAISLVSVLLWFGLYLMATTLLD